MKVRALPATVLVLLSVCGCVRPLPDPPHGVGRVTSSIAKPPLTLARAIRLAARLGPAGANTTVDLSFGLRPRNPRLLAALVASGRTVSAADYSAEFGPDPALVERAVAVLVTSSLHASWRPGSSLIAADGPAPAVARLLSVDIETYRLPGGATFYASLEEPRMPAALAAVTSGVSGLDDYRRARAFAVRPGGLTPTDVLGYYNIKPLRDAGLDGTGQTILLPEIDDLPNMSDLNKFADLYGLPSFDSVLTVKRDPNWGTPEKPQGETALDLEIIHSIAPNAKLVVYISAPDFAHGDRAFDQMVADHLGSIVSESLGACEPDTPSGHRNTYASIQDRAVVLGMSHFVATGDNGAYTCGLDQDPAGSFPSTLPTVTAVGGTSVFESEQGVYYKESAWGSPLDQSGSGGGASQFYPAPDYQQQVLSSTAHGLRQVPDVAADADPSTGFHIVFGGKEGQAGGTSAATPLWAATVALINEDMKKRGLRQVGFANNALYWMGVNSSKFAKKPFHDVISGNNLGYDAAPGWDFATGWGSMDAAAMDAAWAVYIKSGGG